ncbi:aflatoxin biosynthesis ketoreductase nor-1 [Plectosphaerella cucumerina]|uniref:Aflatoxin biosynthesis ketoreductase nor-1 n=1 Tax=Plectosphaerella cucumerina TaxID=40658 RepID=A0A8K0X810_9PEZI|nr:aflatoxin biosynthesis ketoreductase nor-1 [Plectosphaerella cucumerina]
MSSNTNVLITGVNRGIGRGFLNTFLSRPNHTVIGSVRDLSAPAVSELRAITPAEGSRLVLVKIESSNLSDPAEAVRQLQADGIDTLDIVIANAGITGTQGPIATVDLEDTRKVFEVNTLGPTALFLATRPLLERAANPKWLSISTLLASIGRLHTIIEWPSLSYGTSKAALNFVTQSIHVWHEKITAISVHPGGVDTDMLKASGKFFGLPEGIGATVESSVADIVKILDVATRADHSGKFFSHDGTIIPW